MKKERFFIMLMYLFFWSCVLNAQNFKNNGEPYSFYCKLVCYEKTDGNVDISILFDNLTEGRKLRDFNGKPLNFRTILEAMNFMARRGWTYIEQEKKESKTYLLFRKFIKQEKEAFEGLYFDRNSLDDAIL